MPQNMENPYVRAVRCLAQMECPTFSDINPRLVVKAFMPGFKMLSIDPQWVAEFNRELAKRSNGKVRIEILDEPTNIRGPGSNFNLICGEDRKKIFIGPYSRPIEFV